MSITELNTNGNKGQAKTGRVSVTKLRAMKERGEKIVMLTAYDYSTARLADDAGIPLLLVGDSLGRVMLGYDSEVRVTMDDMLHHTKAVSRGAQRALVIGDMPFMSYTVNPDEAMRNAARFLQEGGARAVKVEGAAVAPTIERIVAAGIPVMGHLGLTPQSINVIGGHKIQGKTHEAAEKILRDALALERAGCFAIVLETVPTALAGLVSRKLSIPTIGIGAGVDCDGQVLVIGDLLGVFERFTPRFAKRYAEIGGATREALARFAAEARAGEFPTHEHGFAMSREVLAALEADA
jgi:3-methyl-2-oxobutanoate hydroxymethyltransferase